MTRFLDDFLLIGCWALVAYWSRPHYKYGQISKFWSFCKLNLTVQHVRPWKGRKRIGKGGR